MSRALLFLQHFPGGAAPGRATGGGAACGFPGGAAPGRATGWWCGLWVSRRRCAWPGYWLVVRPVGFPAALRLAGLLAGGASCGMSSPGEAFMPTPGRFTGVRCEKSPYFRTSSHLEYGGEGGIRTPDTLPYTHFPGVLLQPLGHLTILSCCSPWGATGRYYRELR